MLFVFNGGVLVLAGFLLLWHAVAGLATLGGDFADAVWTPFSEQVLGRGDPIAPRPKAAAWRSAISRAPRAETCMHVANANAHRIGGDPCIEVSEERADGALLLCYDDDGRGMEGLLPALRGLAAELGERYLPGSPSSRPAAAGRRGSHERAGASATETDTLALESDLTGEGGIIPEASGAKRPIAFEAESGARPQCWLYD